MKPKSNRPLKARLGLHGYVRLLAAFRDEPATITEVGIRLGLGNDTVFRLVPDFHAKGLVHVSGWRMTPYRPTVPIYAYGPGEDAAPPTQRANGRAIKPRLLVRERVSPEVLALASLLDEIATPTPIYQIAEATGLHRDTIGKALAALKAAKLARIAQWQQRDGCGGRYMAAYQLASGNDAPYPSRKKMRQRTNEKWQAKRKQATPIKALERAISRLAANEEREAA